MQKPLIIGITGGSGSGKTTFIRSLRSHFREDELCIISQDDYYRPREVQKTDQKGVHNFDRPKSIDKKEFIADIKKIIEGKVVERAEYTFNNKEAEPKKLTFTPAPILIVEGIFVFHFSKIRELLDIKIFLHAKENLKVIRRIKRDKEERNYPLEDVLYRYEHHVMPTFEKYIKPYMDEADIIINNNLNFNHSLEVIIGYLQSHLSAAQAK